MGCVYEPNSPHGVLCAVKECNRGVKSWADGVFSQGAVLSCVRVCFLVVKREFAYACQDSGSVKLRKWCARDLCLHNECVHVCGCVCPWQGFLL